MKKKIKKTFYVAVILFVLVMPVYVWSKDPSHNRVWELGQEELPKITVQNNIVQITNLRNFKWSEEKKDTQKEYITREVNLSDIEGVDVVIAHFSFFGPLAHAFLNFNVRDGEDFGVSIETRREVGEYFSPVGGVFSNYELIYVVASYSDLIGLRSVRDEEVYLYPTIASPERSQELLLSISEDINKLYETPQFYNTITKNCTNILAGHVERLTGLKFPLLYKTFAPGNIDKALYKMEIIENPEDTFKKTKDKYLLQF